MQKKKVLINLFLVVAIIAIALTGIYVVAQNIPVAFAMELDGNEYDQVFLENIQVLAKDNDGADINISAQKELLYDINLQKLGYVYDFSVNEEKGYAIVIYTFGEFEVAELFFNTKNPYNALNDCKRIYVCDMTYLYFAEDNYYFAKTNELLNQELLDSLKEVAHFGGYDDLTSESETINFTSKSEDTYQLAKKHPYLVGSDSFPNGCAAVSGANIMQFWDRYKTNLIPNYNPGSSIASYYLYYGKSDATDKLTSDLFYDMETNSTGVGATIDQFKAGMEKYVKRNGNYQISYNSCMSAGNFDYNIAKNYIDNGQPIALFLSMFNVITIKTQNNSDNLSIKISKYNHTMTAFGYKDITYTLTNGTKRNDKYLVVATGIKDLTTGYFNISYKTNIKDAFGVQIN